MVGTKQTRGCLEQYGKCEAKDFRHTTHGHELRQGMLEGLRVLGGGGKEGKIGTTGIA